jgi:hypothetical protein
MHPTDHTYAASSSSTLNPIDFRPFSSGCIICRMASNLAAREKQYPQISQIFAD